jgi:hypothetical protein
MKRLIVAVGVLVTVAFAQSGINPPAVGFIRDSQSALRPVYGLAGNFVAGDALAENVQSAAFSGLYGLLKTEERLSVFDQEGRRLCEWPAPGGPAFFAFSSGSRDAFVFLSETSELLRLRGCRVRSLPLDPVDLAGEVMSISAFAQDLVGLVLKRQETLWLIVVSFPSGRVEWQTPLSGTLLPVLLRNDCTLLFAQGREIVLRKPDGLERRIPLHSSAARLAQMGDGWIHIVEASEEGSPGGHLALRLLEDHEELYRLPRVTP